MQAQPRIHRKPVSMHNLALAAASPAPRRQPSNYSLRGDADTTQRQFSMRDVEDRHAGHYGPPARAWTMAAAEEPPPPAYTPYAAAVTPTTPAVQYDEAPPLPARPPLPTRPTTPADVGQFAPGITSRPGPAAPLPPPPTPTFQSTTAPPLPAEGNGDAGKPKDTFWKTALDETRFFASGLLQKPYESTKHYTILRHSSGLIMYRGPSTSVVVTLFSSPDHRIVSSPPGQRTTTVWLQRRGYSGDAGLRLKTLVGANSSWLDVTPERPAAANELPAADERGYQRDLHKFMKKTVAGSKHYDKSVAGRVPCETLVVRIPAACTDGYFRLIVCGHSHSGGGHSEGTHKKKVLCGSPVFRVASMSTDASVLRGASLATLPLEAGVAVASMLGARYAAGAAAPVVTAVQTQIEKYQTGITAAQTAYENSRLASGVDAADETYAETRATAYQALTTTAEDAAAAAAAAAAEDDVPPEVVGDDRGPSPPFPIQFQGRVVPGTGRSAAELGVPTANLAGVPDDLRLRLRGVYFGWASIVAAPPPTNKKSAEAAGIARLPEEGCWIEAIVTVAPPRQPSKAAVVLRNEVSAHLLYDLGAASSLVDATVNILLMAFLSSNVVDAVSSPRVSSLVVASLSRPAWGAQATLARAEAERSERSLSQKTSDKYVDARGRVQKQVDRIPFHWAGVRTASGEMRDQLYGNGGFWVPR